MVGDILKYAALKWLEIDLNGPPWLEKILKYAGLKWLEINLNSLPRLHKIFMLASNGYKLI